MRSRHCYIPLLILECYFLWTGEVWCQSPDLANATSTPSGHHDWPTTKVDSGEDDRAKRKMLNDSDSALLKLTKEAEEILSSTEEAFESVSATDQKLKTPFENSQTFEGFPEIVNSTNNNSSSLTDIASRSDNQNIVETNFSSRLPDTFSSGGWRPILNPKTRARKIQSDYTTVVTTEAPKNSTVSEDVGSTTPFNGSPPLSESGWIPIPHPKPMRKGRTRVIYEHDYDDIITAPPPPRHGESFELVVGASLSGASTHPRPNFNHSSNIRVKIVEPPRSVIKKRNAGDDVFTATKSINARSSSGSGYELLPEGNWTIVEKTTLVQKFLSDVLPAEKLVIRQPVSVSRRIGEPYLGEDWPDFKINTPQPIVYLPDEHETFKESSFSLSNDYDSRVPFITRITKAPAWTDSSAINHMFTVPKLEFRPSTGEGRFDQVFDTFPEIDPPVEARNNPNKEVDLINEEAFPLQGAQKTQPGSVVINTARGPHNMYAYNAGEPTEGLGRNENSARSLNKQQKLDTKHFVSENDSMQTKGEEKNKTSLAVQPFMSTESLAYILIGACCGLSILCLLVVIVTMRCRRSLDEQKSFSSIHHQPGGLINGWVADPYPKEPVLIYENNVLRSPNDIHTIQIDPWFNRSHHHDMSNIDFHRPSVSSMPPHGLRFETLGVGPSKQLKRTTVIPGHSTALVTDGHTAVMRELSSASSSSSASSISSTENYHPYQPIEEAPESLDIQEDLFDQTSVGLHKIQNTGLPNIAEEPSQPDSVLGPSDSMLADGRVDVDAPDSMIHWSTNDERLI